MELNSLTLDRLGRGVGDLLDERADALDGLHAPQIYLPRLRDLHRRFQALPAALRGRPLTAEIADANGSHDGHGATLWFVTEAVLRDPDSDDEDLAAAQRLRDAFLPALSDLKASHDVHAERALARRETLERHRADLERFQTPSGHTLFEKVTAFIDAGLQLDALLRERATQAVAHERGAEVATLRGELIRTLGRFRDALTDEVADRPDLPPDLVPQTFGFLTQLGNNT